MNSFRLVLLQLRYLVSLFYPVYDAMCKCCCSHSTACKHLRLPYCRNSGSRPAECENHFPTSSDSIILLQSPCKASRLSQICLALVRKFSLLIPPSVRTQSKLPSEQACVRFLFCANEHFLFRDVQFHVQDPPNSPKIEHQNRSASCTRV